jgi:acyl carrier protein
MSNSKEETIKILVEQLQINSDEVSDALTFGDLPQWDSLGHMMLISALEEKYGEEINTEAIAELVNFKAIQGYIEKHSHG